MLLVVVVVVDILVLALVLVLALALALVLALVLVAVLVDMLVLVLVRMLVVVVWYQCSKYCLFPQRLQGCVDATAGRHGLLPMPDIDVFDAVVVVAVVGNAVDNIVVVGCGVGSDGG